MLYTASGPRNGTELGLAFSGKCLLCSLEPLPLEGIEIADFVVDVLLSELCFLGEFGSNVSDVRLSFADCDRGVVPVVVCFR